MAAASCRHRREVLVNAARQPRSLDAIYWKDRKKRRGAAGRTLDVFRHRDDPAVREAYVVAKEKEAAARKPKRGAKKGPAQARRKRAALISLETPEIATKSASVNVRVHYDLEAELGTQRVHVTLKAGKLARRVDRKVVDISGSGEIEVTFELPDDVPDNIIQFAAFVGKDYSSNMQHIQTGPIPLK